jgi:hypothetical protein
MELLLLLVVQRLLHLLLAALPLLNQHLIRLD